MRPKRAHRAAQPLPEPFLVNGSTGIAVGMATNIPPHNMSEVIDGAVALIEEPELDLAGLMEHIKGPDFPTGGIIMGRSGIRAAYATGRGKITQRGRAEIEEKKERPVPDCDHRDPLYEQGPHDREHCGPGEGQADRGHQRPERRVEPARHAGVVELKKEANPQVVLNQLYRYTQLQDTVGVILLALDGGVPKIMTLEDHAGAVCVEFQDQVIRRRTQFDLKKPRSGPTFWKALPARWTLWTR